MLLVVLDHDRGELDESTREALTFGRVLAAKMGAPMEAALVGSDDGDLVAAAAEHGAATVHTCVHEILVDYGPDAHGSVVAQMVEALDPAAVLAGGSDRGNEVMAHAAARLDTALATNCLDVAPGDPWSMTRLQWGGSLLEDCTLEGDVALLTCAVHALAAAPAGGRRAEIRPFTAALNETHAVTMVRDRIVGEAGVTLSTANVVCGGGRGVGSEEGFAPLEELAALLGGRVGCSRAVTNLGWRPHSDQVGQTGTRIAPEIYIASGISGAVQHWVGAMASKHILAINTDREANMVAKADWAVIADLHEVIPAIIEEVRHRRG